jgi:hypothetical protein
MRVPAQSGPQWDGDGLVQVRIEWGHFFTGIKRTKVYFAENSYSHGAEILGKNGTGLR